MKSRPGRGLEGELLGRAAHDLKNPLAVVRASLEWLESELRGREELLDALRDATAATDRLLTISDDLDALARLDSEGVAARDSVPLVPLVNAVVASANGALGARGIAVETFVRRTRSAAGGPSHSSGGVDRLELKCDQRLLGRSLTALVEATARGAPSGTCIDVTLARTESDSGDRAIEVGVALRGTVDVAALEATLDALASGGLGVYVALRVVRAHGGSLAVVPTTSLPRVVIRLPC